MLKTPLRFFLIAVMFCLQVSISYSQTSCPDDYNENSWTAAMCIVEPWPGVSWGYVGYHFKDEGSKRRIVIDWTNIHNGSDLKESTIKELLNFLMCRDEGFLNSDGVKEVAFYNQVECKVDLSCKYKVVSIGEGVHCDDPLIDPGIFNYNNEYYTEYVRPKTCGYKCCEKVYSYTCIYNDLSGEYDVTFNGITNNVITDCDNSQTYYDCKTGLPKSCHADCP